jgi:hypothetical protein
MKQTGSRKGNEGVEMKFSYQWHGRLGWVIAPLLAMQALGGAMLLWMQPLPASHDSPPAIHEWAHAVDAGVAELASRYPAAKIEYVNLPRDAPGPVSVRLLASPSNESGWADIDVATAQAGALQPDNSRLKTFLYGLHEHMLRWCWSRWACGSGCACGPCRRAVRGAACIACSAPCSCCPCP